MREHLRLVDEGSATERDLILAGRSDGMSPEERARVWTAVAAGCVAGGAAVASAAVGAKAGLLARLASTLAAWKGTVACLLVVGGSVATYALNRPAPPPDTQPVVPGVIHPASAPPPAPLPTEGSMSDEARAPGPAMPPPVLPRPASAIRPSKPTQPGIIDSPPRPAESPRAADSSRLAEESRMVIEARRALHAGDFTTTLRVLSEAAAAFPNGTLAQEREALTIQALARSGQREAAARRATAFLANYPESPHAADLKAFTR